MGQVELPHVALREILAVRHERDGRRFAIPRTDGFDAGASVGIVSLEPSDHGRRRFSRN
jgi:hypothetical protein